MKEEKLSAIVVSGDCKDKLTKLKAHLSMKTYQEVTRYVLEKSVSSLLSKAINNTLKGINDINEEEK